MMNAIVCVCVCAFLFFSCADACMCGRAIVLAIVLAFVRACVSE